MKCAIYLNGSDALTETLVHEHVVAMTRSKRHLCVVGDSETLGKKDAFLKAWMAFLGEHAEVRYLD